MKKILKTLLDIVFYTVKSFALVKIFTVFDHHFSLLQISKLRSGVHFYIHAIWEPSSLQSSNKSFYVLIPVIRLYLQAVHYIQMAIFLSLQQRALVQERL